eukprot:TRINITY_DN1660_c0_g2_i6.p1 TRINITY_DN1660_c0_g2~~TRINITY_DN1660_c0_g2_i6.p1  ORF type:complete len:413 (-),score=69.34 TRINITY_DN1660_c0_g2_i6:625-1863(-)
MPFFSTSKKTANALTCCICFSLPSVPHRPSVAGFFTRVFTILSSVPYYAFHGSRSCGTGLYCKDNKCAKTLADGVACTSDDQCNSTMCNKNKKCAPIFFVGDTCTDPADEQGANVECPVGTSCLRTVIGNVHCQGAKEGKACDLTTDFAKRTLCDLGLYCKLSGATNGTCTKQLELDATCKVTNAERNACGPLANCNAAASTTSQEGKCQLYYSQAKDAKCAYNAQCQWGQICQGGKCIAVDNTTVCSNKANETCGNTYGSCDCVSNSQKCVVPKTNGDCGSHLLNLIKCINSKGCGATSYPRDYVWRDVNSCAYSCNQHYLNFACCVNRPFDLPNGVACPLPDRELAVAAGVPAFLVVALLSLAILLKWPQTFAPGLWLKLCGWRWWPEEIEEFKRMYMEDNEPVGIKKEE